jgi:hypothetical protein
VKELVKDFRNIYEIVLRKKFGSKGDEVIGARRRLHNEELCGLSSSENAPRVIRSRIMRLVGHVARIADGRVACKVLVGRPNGKRPLGRPRRLWEDNIKMDFKK